MIQVFNIMHNTDHVNRDLLTRSLNTTTRGHNFKLHTVFCKKEVRKNCFPFRIVKTWNDLSEKTVNAANVNIFKELLDIELKNLMFNFD